MPTVRESYPELYEFLDSATEKEKAEFFGKYALHLQGRFGKGDNVSMREWINAFDLGGPKLKHNTEMACWVALDEDPCHSGSCNQRGCHNYQNGFDKPDRLIIVSTKQRTGVKE